MAEGRGKRAELSLKAEGKGWEPVHTDLFSPSVSFL